MYAKTIRVSEIKRCPLSMDQTVVSEVRTASIIRVMRLRGTIFQKALIFILVAVRT
jgi:hypothetical protein